MFLKEFRGYPVGFADLLNYASLPEDGIMLGKDGSLTASWYFRGPDADSSSGNELESISARLNASLLKFDAGWMMQIDMIRKSSISYPKTTKSCFPDKVSFLIDYERSLQFENSKSNFENIYAISLTYLPPSKTKGKLLDIIYSDDNESSSEETSGDRILNLFKKSILDFENSLSVVFNNFVWRMSKIEDDRDELLEYLHYACMGGTQKIKLPKLPIYLDSLIGAGDFTGGIEPKIGNNYIKVIAIEGFPMESYPSILDDLNHLPFEYRWNNRFIFFDKEEAESVIDGTRKKWKRKIRGFRDQLLNTNSGAINLDASNMAGDAELALSESASGCVKFGNYSSNIILMHHDRQELEEAALLVVKTIKNIGFVPRIETLNTIEAYLGSLPSHGKQNIRNSMIHTLNLADLVPTTAIWKGDAYNSCPFYPKDSPPLFYGVTKGNVAFRFSLHVGDVGHALVLGPTGSGKSSLLSFIMAGHLRYKNAKLFCFDKGYSAFILAKACGGSHYDIAGENNENNDLSFCPLANIHLENERIWAADWICSLLEIQHIKITPNYRQKIHQALNLLAASDFRTMTDFVNTVQDLELREELTPYTLAGSMGKLLDAKEDKMDEINAKSKSNFQVFEMEHLMNLGEKNIVPILQVLFHKIDRQLDGSPTLIILDESWLFISHPIFREKIRSWLKELRKNNVAVIFATQSISDITNSPIRDVIYESCPTKIFLPNLEANNDISKNEYLKLGLNEEQINIIKNAIPKKQYYYTSSMGKRLFELNLGDVALSFVGKSSKEDLKQVRNLINQNPNNWQEDWLRTNVSDEWATEYSIIQNITK